MNKRLTNFDPSKNSRFSHHLRRSVQYTEGGNKTRQKKTLFKNLERAFDPHN